METGEYGGTYSVSLDGKADPTAQELDAKAVFEGQGDVVTLNLLGCSFAGKQVGGGRITLEPRACQLPGAAQPMKLGGEAVLDAELLTITLNGPRGDGAVLELEFSGMKAGK